MTWPARSPDMNHIEHEWVLLGKRVRSRLTPHSNLQQLRNALSKEWNRIDQTDIQNVIEGLNRRMHFLYKGFNLSSYMIRRKAQLYMPTMDMELEDEDVFYRLCRLDYVIMCPSPVSFSRTSEWGDSHVSLFTVCVKNKSREFRYEPAYDIIRMRHVNQTTSELTVFLQPTEAELLNNFRRWTSDSIRHHKYAYLLSSSSPFLSHISGLLRFRVYCGPPLNLDPRVPYRSAVDSRYELSGGSIPLGRRSFCREISASGRGRHRDEFGGQITLILQCLRKVTCQFPQNFFDNLLTTYGTSTRLEKETLSTKMAAPFKRFGEANISEIEFYFFIEIGYGPIMKRGVKPHQTVTLISCKEFICNIDTYSVRCCGLNSA
ncbi:hypothetical protein ANN_23368 [Periplaneta americana]|uniref:Tc1-like transposase DDE domain-containing protein n=1 Tax=Periplaneta americana TaxID=6978 RepID=A0ABQ8SMC7_PERAM|nr:hypothetical protein ANN_23368 [Periplaneta americana]